MTVEHFLGFAGSAVLFLGEPMIFISFFILMRNNVVLGEVSLFSGGQSECSSTILHSITYVQLVRYQVQLVSDQLHKQYNQENVPMSSDLFPHRDLGLGMRLMTWLHVSF